MKHRAFALAFVFSFVVAPAFAQEEDTGKTLMERGIEMFFEGFMKEVEPLTEDLKQFAEDMEPNLQALAERMGPALQQLSDKIDDMNNYEAPEVMPNGDIIIRRKPDAPERVSPEGEVEI
ncbi:hypothetical protein [Nereida sp. MMG025]|uniref:hypothetical protein n=1 Tax=Nereida sp. MMG025 TaxID=2909981 RepID=UPI001F23F929|nr:hypothetical protein [Nereida sp. MMG025]MCF6443907.1 hypothetical protein [Nereida sp. MMG025]